jgi:ATP-dependent DNA helicase RecG
MENDMFTTLCSKTKFNIKLSPKAKRYRIDGKNVLAFYIPSSDIKLVYFNGLQNTFIHTDSGDQQPDMISGALEVMDNIEVIA